LQMGVSLQPEMNVLAQLLRGLMLIGAGSVFFIGAGAWLVAGRYIRRTQLAFEKQQSFVANASHELRAPLTLIRAGIEVAKRESTDPRQAALLESSLSDADYMKRLIEDLLLLSRLDTQTVRLDKEIIQFPAFLETIARKLEVIAAESHITISAESEKFELSADPSRLQQVLFILVDNAVRHNHPGGFVKLTGKLVGDHVQIAVADSGKGIPREHLEKVFDRFYTVDDGSKAAKKGSGLGLSIARGLVHAHQGRIKIDSKSGKGTVVTLTLPQKSKSGSRNPFLTTGK
ncbi:HAMP domain-containing histidine kinase, partial [bacterium]|nr:HAMP domain-containing histidine kinase [bacterium]